MKSLFSSWFKTATKSVTAKALLSITVVLIFPLVFSAVYLAKDYIENSLLEGRQQLMMVLTELDAEIHPLINKILFYKNSPDLSVDTKITEINKLLQPRIEKVSASNPGIGIGYYDLELDSILAITPNFSPTKLRRLDRSASFYQSYVDTKSHFSYINTPIDWDEKNTLILNHPLYYGENIIGHAWVSRKTGDIYVSAWIMAFKTIMIGLALWSIVLILIRKIIRQMQNSLHSLSLSIIDDHLEAAHLTDFPELEPVFSKIKTYAHELKMTNDDLNRVNSLLTNIMEGITEGFFSLNPQWQFTYLNKKVEELTGRERQTLLGKKIWDEYPNMIDSNTYHQLQRVMNENQSAHWELLRHSGHWYEFHAYPFKEGLSVFIRDITSEKTLEENAFELASLVENANIAIIGRTVDGIITSWNPGAVKLFGYEPSEVLGKHLFEIIAPEGKAITAQAIESSKKGETMPVFESVGIRKDGTKIYLSVVISLVRNLSGKVIRVSAIMSDITTIKRTQKEFARLDRLNLIGQMAAGISHEVRNPLTTVRGFLQMLGAKSDLKPYQDHFSLMISELDRANSIITEFLSLSKDRPLNLIPGNMNHLVSKLFPIVQADAFNSGKDISIELEKVPEIWMDENEVRQLILNLIRNALEATTPGTRVTIRTRKNEKRQVVLEVEDHGKGIPPEILEKLGNPFITTKDNGTGIGLSICYGIAERHQAEISVKTGIGGTTFYVTFPPLEIKDE